MVWQKQCRSLSWDFFVEHIVTLRRNNTFGVTTIKDWIFLAYFCLKWSFTYCRHLFSLSMFNGNFTQSTEKTDTFVIVLQSVLCIHIPIECWQSSFVVWMAPSSNSHNIDDLNCKTHYAVLNHIFKLPIQFLNVILLVLIPFLVWLVLANQFNSSVLYALICMSNCQRHTPNSVKTFRTKLTNKWRSIYFQNAQNIW